MFAELQHGVRTLGLSSAAWFLLVASMGFSSGAGAATIYLDDFSGSGDGALTFGAFTSGGSPPTNYWTIGDETTVSLVGGVSNSSPGNQFLGSRDVDAGPASQPSTPAVATFINGLDLALGSISILSIDIAASQDQWESGQDFVEIIVIVDGVATVLERLAPTAASGGDLAQNNGAGAVIPTSFTTLQWALPFNGAGTFLEEIRIEILSTGDLENVLFDNVQVDSNVPEPATIGLFGAGVLALAFLRRKRQN